MKKLAMAALAAASFATMAQADPAEGMWKTEPGESGGYLYVAMSTCGANLCGTIKQAFDDSGTVQLDYEHLGKPIIRDMGADGGGSYSGGTIWAPDTDKTYKSKMALAGDSLEVKGCVAGGLICRGQTWTRVK
ncbi:DUF2147 domain-containing protein [Albibacillus kandeliae]|uniref:DUF2147 domain-containing protein n=1 Tax=Albibacillus kandeliae TaxID=2174228 RepID=UPI000D68E8D9|nr:DUF2147 domain-containing protein [Albibacillus kandeliae]